MRCFTATAWTKKILCLLACLVLTSCISPSGCGWTIALAKSDDLMESGPLEYFQKKYDSLSPKGRFVAGATVGFVGTRIAAGSAITAIKVGAIAFITAEVLQHAGVLDYEDVMDDIQENDFFRALSSKCKKGADDFRLQVRQRLKPESIKAFIEKEKMASLGAAGGTILGVLLL